MPIVTALLTTAVTAAAAPLTERAVDGMPEWKSEVAIEEKVMQRAVLGSSDDMKRTSYVSSPILKHMKEFGGQPGVVNVAYVPPLMGKTTACHAMMNKYVQEGINRGLCFSPNDSSRPYLEQMATLLGFTDTDTGIPSVSVGFVAGVLEALVVSRDGPSSFLILDDFMPDGPTNTDIDLLVAIKTRIRSMNMIVFVLTASRDSADYMLTMDSLESIIPLVGPAAMKNIRAEFKQGQYKRRDESFHLDWETHLSMEWGATEMKDAILVNPLYQGKSAEEQQDLKLKIDTLLQQYTDEDRKELSPAVVLQALNYLYSSSWIQSIQTLPSSEPETSPEIVPAPQETGHFCSGWCAM